jgi:hypothetical protein
MNSKLRRARGDALPPSLDLLPPYHPHLPRTHRHMTKNNTYLSSGTSSPAASPAPIAPALGHSPSSPLPLSASPSVTAPSPCSRRNARSSEASSPSCSGSSAEAPTALSSPPRVCASGMATAHVRSSTHAGCSTEGRAILVLCMVFSGDTLEQSMSMRMKTTPGRASIS